MTAALFRHIWLLMTFRHPLTGLPTRSTSLFVAIVAASCLFAQIRWGDEYPFAWAIHGFLLVVWAWLLSPRIAAAAALLSIGVDLLALPFGDRFDTFFQWYELACAVVIGWRGIDFIKDAK